MHENLITPKCTNNDCQETEDIDPYLIDGRIAWYCSGCVCEAEMPDDRIPIDLPEGYTLISEIALTAVVEEQSQIKKLLIKYEETIRVTTHGYNYADRIQSVFSHLERKSFRELHNYIAMKDKVIEHLLGVRLLVNMVLNGDWTHSQKNNTIQALGELTETGIKRLREKYWELGQYHDPFVPTWSLSGQYHARVKAEEERDELSKKLSEMRSKYGIPIIDDDGKESDKP